MLSPIDVFREYFAKRGMTEQDIDANGIRLHTFERIQTLHPRLPTLQGRSGFAALIPYYDADKQPAPYHVARILHVHVAPSAWSAAFGDDVAKLACPTGIPRAYFPLGNPEPGADVDCIITESAIKSMILSKMGYYAIGLNGCWGFTSKGASTRLLPDLMTVPFQSFRSVRFLPDSDVSTNPKVMSAASRLFADLQRQFRIDMQLIVLPHANDGSKWGIDDFYGHHGHQKTKEFIDETDGEAPEMNEFLECMTQLNANVSYIRDMNLFALQDENQLIDATHFHMLHAPLTYPSGDKLVPASRTWVGWEQRAEVKRVVNRPGWPITDNNEFYNLWRPSDVEPRAGDVGIHTTFLERAIPDLMERRYVEQWIAHTVQRPEERKATALVLFSDEQGTGKTMLAETVGKMLGSHNTAHVSMDVLTSHFNSSYVTKQLIILNETHMPTRAAAEAIMDKLKTMITERTVSYHAKGRDPYDMETYACYILTTNHAHALKIEPTDRRFMVVGMASQFRHSEMAELWGERCWQWHQDHVPELLHHYLAMDISDFRPGAPAMMTTAKMLMAEAGYSEYELIAAQLKEDPMQGLGAIGLPESLRCVTAQMLVQAASPGELRNLQTLCVRMGRAMGKMGFTATRANIRTPKGRETVRYFDLLRSTVTPSPEEVARDLMKVSGGSSKF